MVWVPLKEPSLHGLLTFLKLLISLFLLLIVSVSSLHLTLYISLSSKIDKYYNLLTT